MNNTINTSENKIEEKQHAKWEHEREVKGLRLREVSTANGDIFRGLIEVSGEEYRVESDRETWLNVIDSEGRCEQFIFEHNECIAVGGEYVTAKWTEEQFSQPK